MATMYNTRPIKRLPVESVAVERNYKILLLKYQLALCHFCIKQYTSYLFLVPPFPPPFLPTTIPLSQQKEQQIQQEYFPYTFNCLKETTFG